MATPAKFLVPLFRSVVLGSWVCLSLLLLCTNLSFAASSSTIPTLPGYSGILPFKLETGYISVGELDDVQLFYYFIESERNPAKDPLILWLTGGPGCSALSGLIFETGPLMFDLPAFDWSLPSFVLNAYSWTKIANIIFLDSPVGTGFSYSTTSRGYDSTDIKTTNDIYNFLWKWLLDHPDFIKNPLYIGGDSYAGVFVPMIVLEISNGNEAGHVPHMSLQGYILGNPRTTPHEEENSRIPYAYHLGLISDKYYELAKISCNGEYANPDPTNALCSHYLQLITQCIKRVNNVHVLDPTCESDSPYTLHVSGRNLRENIMNIRLPSQEEKLWCRTQNYLPSNIWANDPTVQNALHIKRGTIKQWKRCNKTLSYTSDVPDVFEYHKLLSLKDLRALVYSGDHDMLVPYTSTLQWIRNLNISMDYDWRPWFVDGQVAGFTEKYMEKWFSLTFATLKGGGHTAPEYKPKQCFVMLDRWFSLYQL